MQNIISLSKTARDAKIGKESVINSNYILSNKNHSLRKEEEIFQKKSSQIPLINRIYRNRILGMNKLKDNSILTFQQLNCSQIQYLIIGCGYDNSSISINEEKEKEEEEEERNIDYKVYLIDFVQVINERKELNLKNDKNKILIGCDLCNLIELFQLLEENQFQYNIPTIIISECVLSYIPQSNVRSLLSKISSKIMFSILIIYDPILSLPLVGQQLLQTFRSRNVPLHSAMNSTVDMIRFLRDCSFKHINSLNIQQFLHCVSLPTLLTTDLNTLEPFDEFAELIAFNQLYAFTYCTNHQEIFRKFNQNLFIWYENNSQIELICNNNNNNSNNNDSNNARISAQQQQQQPSTTQINQWNYLRYEMLNNRLLALENKLKPSSSHSTSQLTQDSQSNLPHPPPHHSIQNNSQQIQSRKNKSHIKQKKRSSIETQSEDSVNNNHHENNNNNSNELESIKNERNLLTSQQRKQNM